MTELTRIDRASDWNEFRACFAVERSERVDHRQRGILDNKACQAAGRIGAGIDIDPVGPHLYVEGRSMSVNDNFAEILIRPKEFLSYPKQVALLLAR